AVVCVRAEALAGAVGAAFGGAATPVGAEVLCAGAAAFASLRGTSFTGPKGSSCSRVLLLENGRDEAGWCCSAIVHPTMAIIASVAAASSVRIFPDTRAAATT